MAEISDVASAVTAALRRPRGRWSLVLCNNLAYGKESMRLDYSGDVGQAGLSVHRGSSWLEVVVDAPGEDSPRLRFEVELGGDLDDAFCWQAGQLGGQLSVIDACYGFVSALVLPNTDS